MSFLVLEQWVRTRGPLRVCGTDKGIPRILQRYFDTG